MEIKLFPANSDNYTRGRTSTVKYIVIHYTANDGDTARGNCNYFSSPGRNASAHYFVDENDIYQSVADADTAWSVGAKTYIHTECRNKNSISVEMCSRKDSCGNYCILGKTIDNTVELVKFLMDKYAIPLSHVLRHYDVTGKICPEPFVRETSQWTAFKNSLEESEMEKVYNTVEELPPWAQSTIQKLIDKKYLSGDGENLGLSETAVKVFVVNDRAGLY